jgi:tripartite-type tricarboxylate transporter receptor subunit TctC
MTRSRFTALVAALLCLVGAAAHAQTFPDRAIHIVVPYPPSGSSDMLARWIGQKLSERWKVPVVVDNRPGAAGNVGMETVARAEPDGYTLVMTNNAQAINVGLYPAPFDIEKDFEPLGLIGSSPMVLAVNPSLPVKSLTELTALAKSEPGKLTYGSCGVGTPQQLAIEMYRELTGIKMLHVPYRGCAPAVADAIGGQIQIIATTAGQMAPQIKAGLLRPIASTSKHRSSATPDVPTFEEAGLKDYDLDIWFGMMAPAKTPAPILDKIHDAVAEILQTPESRKRLETLGVDLFITSRAEHAKTLHDDIAKYKKLIDVMQIEKPSADQ